MNYWLNHENISRNPFNLSNDFVEFYYYPESTNDLSHLSFSLIKENQTITAINWNAYNAARQNISVQIQVPKLTILIWSGKLKF